MPTDDRELDQIQLLLAALPGAAVHPADWRERETVDYLYREGCLLVRTADVARVITRIGLVLEPRRNNELAVFPESDGDDGPRSGGLRVVERDTVRVSTLLNGVTRVRYRSADPDDPNDDRMSVPDMLAGLDDAGDIGIGTARPESVLYACGHACPATEPEEVPPGTTDPFPAPPKNCGCTPASGTGVLVGVVDIGWQAAAAAQHWWLAGVEGEEMDPWVAGAAGPDENKELVAYAGHGTFVAGCVRATAPGAEVYVNGALSTPSSAQFETDMVAALARALERSPDVVVFTFTTKTRGNLSLAGFDDLYESVIRHRKDLAFLAPAGNDGERTVQWPAAYPWVLSVGALSADGGRRAHFSNFGGWVDVYAPGQDLTNAFPTGVYVCKERPNVGVRRRFTGMATWSGTSFATPLVAGMVASRMAATGENGRQAVAALKKLARSQHVPGVGPVLLPGQDCCGEPA